MAKLTTKKKAVTPKAIMPAVADPAAPKHNPVNNLGKYAHPAKAKSPATKGKAPAMPTMPMTGLSMNKVPPKAMPSVATVAINAMGKPPKSPAASALPSNRMPTKSEQFLTNAPSKRGTKKK